MLEINKTGFKKVIVNLFGGVGYLFCALQWLWAVLLYFSLINALFLYIKSNNVVEVVDQSPASVDSFSNIFLIIFSVIIIIIVLMLTVYVIVKIPSTIVKTGKKVVNETADNLTPLILKVQHKKDTKKRHQKLTARLILIIKILIIVIPVVLSLLSQFQDKPMVDFNVVVFISIWLAGFSIIAFFIQYLLAKIFAIKRQDLW